MSQNSPLPKTRLEALTDGIFAVTMTLLVLDLKFPEELGTGTAEAVASLVAVLPHLDDYVISFVVLCLYWLAHLRLMSRLRDVDATFVWFNLSFLLFTTFVPKLTALIGDNPGQPIAAIVYGGNLLLILVFEALMWRRCALHLSGERTHDAVELWLFLRRRFLMAGAIILLAIGAALLEIEFGTKVGFASYVYLLLIGAGIVHPRREVARRLDQSARTAHSPRER